MSVSGGKRVERIDTHQHLWRYSAEEYEWIDDAMAALRRDFLLGDLTAAMASAGVDGTVAVQARQSLDETRWLLDIADGQTRFAAWWAGRPSPARTFPAAWRSSTDAPS